jgi:hypothetical protein
LGIDLLADLPQTAFILGEAFQSGAHLCLKAKTNSFCTLCLAANSQSLDSMTFRDLNDLDIVGIYPNYATAHQAWKSKAQMTVDNAHMRYFIVHMHRMLDPDNDSKTGA